MHSKGVVVGSYAANMRGLFITFLNYMGVIFWVPESKGKISISFKLTYLFIYLFIIIIIISSFIPINLYGYKSHIELTNGI
jgi:hypothetical protein